MNDVEERCEVFECLKVKDPCDCTYIGQELEYLLEGLIYRGGKHAARSHPAVIARRLSDSTAVLAVQNVAEDEGC